MTTESRNHGWFIFGGILLLLGAILGLRVPDYDQTFLRWQFIVSHRSILTHGILLPGLLFWLFKSRCQSMGDFGKHTLRLCVMGVLLGSAVHLAYDLFPVRWTGFALIYVPIYGRASALFSQLWIAAGLFLCQHLACRLLRSVDELRLSLGVLCLGFGFEARVASHFLLAAFAALAIASCVAFLLPRPVKEPVE